MSKFDKLVKKIVAKEGKSPEAAAKIAYTAGVRKMGKQEMSEKAQAGKKKKC